MQPKVHSSEAAFVPHLSSGFTCRSNDSSPEISPVLRPGSSSTILDPFVSALVFSDEPVKQPIHSPPDSLLNESLVVVILIEMVLRSHHDSLVRQLATIPLS
jgi:hypothetical protein